MNDETQKNKKGSPKWLRIFLFSCVCLATLIALFYAEEDWRGKSDWENYQREAEAKGAKFNWNDFVPSPVPADQNFAMSPVWIARIKDLWQNDPQKKAEAWYGDRINDSDVAKFLGLVPITPSALLGTNLAYYSATTPPFQVNWTTSHRFDLKPWQSYYRNFEEKNPGAQINITPQPRSPAADVLLALSKFDPAIEQLRQDSQKPYSRFPVQYDEDNPAAIFLPHLAAMKQTSQVLELRAIAELQSGQSDKAFDDTKLMLRLVDSVRTEPFIITHLVRVVVMQMVIQPIYEGLAEHQWTDAQLAELDSELAKVDFLATYHLSVECDDAANVRLFDWLEQKRSRSWILFSLFGPHSETKYSPAVFYLAPKGWFYQADLLNATEDQYWDSAVGDDGQPVVSPAKVSQASDAVKKIINRRTPFSFLSRVLSEWLTPYPEKTAFAQESVDLARVAIALERYRLAQGAYPDSLDALVPKYLQAVPADIINGQPLHYRLTSEGQFVLYSVGWNEQDDGGVAEQGTSIETGIDIDKGDWVWRYPQK